MIKVATSFSGIGSPEEALKELGIEHRNIFACEIDKYARETYLANHKTETMYEDFTTVDYGLIESLDLFVAGFPCQSFSLAGKRLGFDEVRGTLFFNCAEFIRINQPKYFILENVKGLLSHDKAKGSKNKIGRTFGTILNLLSATINNQTNMFPFDDCLDYNVHYKVLNAKSFSVPQNRERVFIIGIRNDLPNDFRFPIGEPLTKRLKDILEPSVNEKYYLSDKMMEYMTSRIANFNGGKINYKGGEDIASTITKSSSSIDISDNIIVEPKINVLGNIGNGHEAHNIYDKDGIAPCVRDMHGKGTKIVVKEATKKGYDIAEEGDSINLSNPNSKTRRGRVGKQIANTLDTSCNQAVVEPNLIKVGNFPGYKQDGVIYSDEGISPTLDTVLHKRPKVYNETQNRIRRLTPLEAMRLMGFPDTFIQPVSDSQKYRQAGNSIVVGVLKSIIQNLIK